MIFINILHCKNEYQTPIILTQKHKQPSSCFQDIWSDEEEEPKPIEQTPPSPWNQLHKQYGKRAYSEEAQ